MELVRKVWYNYYKYPNNDLLSTEKSLRYFNSITEISISNFRYSTNKGKYNGEIDLQELANIFKRKM